MKVVRFRPRDGGAVKYGIHKGDSVQAITGSPFEGMVVETAERHGRDDVTLLAPCTPSKIVALGLNYRDHAEELGMPLPQEPLLFLKPPSAVIGLRDAIVLPEMSKRVDYEAELAVVIGTRTRGITPDDAPSHILGYTCLNDVTARDLQRRDVQFTRSKSFDTFCPMGPWIETDLDPADLQIQCRRNGTLVQSSRTSQLIHPVPEVVSFISRIMTLEPGDVVATGTPRGVGPIKAGDVITVSIENLGELVNHVV